MLRKTCARCCPPLAAMSVFRPIGDARSVSENVVAHNASGNDVCNSYTQEFINLQFALVPYRVKKLKTEVHALLENPSFYTPSPPLLLLEVLKLLAAFWVGTRVGRLSIGGLIEPPQ